MGLDTPISIVLKASEEWTPILWSLRLSRNSIGFRLRSVLLTSANNLCANNKERRMIIFIETHVTLCLS